MLLLLHRPLWAVMVFCAFEKIRGLMSVRSKEALGTIVPKTTEQKLVKRLLIYQQISVHYN